MLHEITKRLAERLRINRDIRVLRRLDDYLLADIGITRKDIAVRVRGER